MCFLIHGCSAASYYGQAIRGQCQLIFQKKSIPEILEDRSIAPDLAKKLNIVLDIRKFANTELKLPVKNNYLHYVDLKRSYVVWNVFACPPLSLTPKSWYYPIVGRMTYRGFFKEEMAKAYAEILIKEGLDVYVGGVPAYSTLGWFKDPITNVILRRSDERIAELIFHELAHQVLYLSDDTAFNESFATAVAHEGMRRWFDKQKKDAVFHRVKDARQRHQAFVALVLEYRNRLEDMYASSERDDQKLKIKKEIIFELKEQYYKVFKTKWDGYKGYDYWFNQPINNAQLSTISTYHDFVPAFLHLLKESHMDLTKFYELCTDLGKLKKEDRHKKLKATVEN